MCRTIFLPPLQNVCVVTTFYTLVGILSILFSGVALDIITCRPRKRWMRRSPLQGFHVFCEPCFDAKESLCHKTKSTKQRVARPDGDLLIHHLRWSPFSAGEGYSINQNLHKEKCTEYRAFFFLISLSFLL